MHRILTALRRSTSSGSYIPVVDGLRFAAIMSVVLFHVPVQMTFAKTWDMSGVWWVMIAHGFRGVPLFFAISGFILAIPFASQWLRHADPVPLRRYFLRRITRLEPPYIAAILIRVLLLLFVVHRPFRDIIDRTAATLLYAHSLTYGTVSAVNPPAWSLEVEAQFYLLAPLLAAAYFRIRRLSARLWIAVLIILASGVIHIWSVPPVGENRFTLSLLNYIQYFLVGFALCDLFISAWDKIQVHWVWDVVSALVWPWIFLGNGRLTQVLLPLAIFVVYLGAFKGYAFRLFFSNIWVTTIGGMCYSIYLTHNLAITGATMLLEQWNVSHVAGPLLSYAVACSGCLLLALGLYVLIERPCMDKNWPAKFRASLKGFRTSLQAQLQIHFPFSRFAKAPVPPEAQEAPTIQSLQ